jgi:hypothetical protein
MKTELSERYLSWGGSPILMTIKGIEARRILSAVTDVLLCTQQTVRKDPSYIPVPPIESIADLGVCIIELFGGGPPKNLEIPVFRNAVQINVPDDDGWDFVDDEEQSWNMPAGVAADLLQLLVRMIDYKGEEFVRAHGDVRQWTERLAIATIKAGDPDGTCELLAEACPDFFCDLRHTLNPLAGACHFQKRATWMVKCTNCGATLTVLHLEGRERLAMEEAQKKGWQGSGWEDWFCPTCKVQPHDLS